MSAEKTQLADQQFESYNFGPGVTCLEHGNWNTDDPRDYTKMVYVSFDDGPEAADSHRLSFHVRFDATGKDTEAYALDVDTGNEVGSMASAENSFDEVQQMVLANYDGGEFAGIEPADVAECGDGLLKYLLVELSKAEDCDGPQAAISRLDTSIRQLEALRAEFERAV